MGQEVGQGRRQKTEAEIVHPKRWQLVSLYLCGSKPFFIKYRSYIECHDSILNSQVETHIYSKKMKAGGASKTSGGKNKSVKRERQ